MEVYNLLSVMIIICRLERVHQRQQYSTEEQPMMHAGGHAALFGEYALLDRLNSHFRLENIVRIVFSSNHCPVEYRRSFHTMTPKKVKLRRSLIQLYDQLEIRTLSSCAESMS